MTTITDQLHRQLTGLPTTERAAILGALPATIEQATLTTVAELRSTGATWAAIGGLLGVTAQAAQQRYGPRLQATTVVDVKPIGGG